MDSMSTNKTLSLKKGLDSSEARRKREDNIIELRKAKREEILSKRRVFVDDENFSTTRETPDLESTSFQEQPSLNDLPKLVEMIHSGSPLLNYDASQGFRKLLSIEKSPPIDDVIKSGVVPRLVEFLSNMNDPKLQFESAWALTNIASGTSDHTRVVIDSGAVPILCQLLKSHEIEVREQAVWALGNIAGDSATHRDKVISAGVLAPILDMINVQAPLSLLRNCTWALSNLCRGRPQPRFETVSAALPALSALLYSNDYEILTDASWALSYLSDGPNDKIQAVIDTDVSSRLIELLRHPDPAVLIPALRTAGNIVTGDDMQTDVMINVGILPCLNELLTSNVKKSIRKEACWTISNITAGTLSQIQDVIQEGIIPPVLHILATAEFEVQKEAAWAISNATSGGRAKEIEYLVSCGCIPPLCEILTCPDVTIIMVALEGLGNILKIGLDVESDSTRSNTFVHMIDECGGLDKIENLQHHKHEEVYLQALSILDKYFRTP